MKEGQEGAIRNPLALFAKLMIATDDGSIPDKMLSYISEFRVGHLLGDPLWSLLPEHLYIYQSACLTFSAAKQSLTKKLCFPLPKFPIRPSLSSPVLLAGSLKPPFLPCPRSF